MAAVNGSFVAQPGNVFLYVLRAGSFCKIGYASDLLSRLTNIRGSCPLEVRLRYKLELPRSVARMVEAKAHETLRSRHTRGEWFKVSFFDALVAVREAHGTMSPAPAPKTPAEISAAYAALIGTRRGPYKLKRRRSHALKIGLKHSGPSAQTSAQEKAASSPLPTIPEAV